MSCNMVHQGADLGRLNQPGTVKVNDLLERSEPSVMHIWSRECKVPQGRCLIGPDIRHFPVTW